MIDEILARSNLQRAFERVRDNAGCRGAELGALFVADDVYVPLARKRPEREPLALPPALDLWTYLELKNREAADGPALYH